MKQNDHCMMPFVLFAIWFVTTVLYMVVVLPKSAALWQLPRLPMKYVFLHFSRSLSLVIPFADMLFYIDLFH